jgi:predicted kinase
MDNQSSETRGSSVSSPRLIVIGGFAGAGKSTLARKVGRALALTVYEIDSIARFIADSRDFHGSNTEAKGVAYDLFWSFARTHLENGNSLVFDQNMGRPQQWESIERVLSEVPGAEALVFILDCPYEICIERFSARTEHPDLDEVDIHEHKFKWDYLNDNAFPGAIRIDATQSEEEVFDEILSHLG